MRRSRSGASIRRSSGVMPGCRRSGSRIRTPRDSPTGRRRLRRRRWRAPRRIRSRRCGPVRRVRTPHPRTGCRGRGTRCRARICRWVPTETIPTGRTTAVVGPTARTWRPRRPISMGRNRLRVCPPRRSRVSCRRTCPGPPCRCRRPRPGPRTVPLAPQPSPPDFTPGIAPLPPTLPAPAVPGPGQQLPPAGAPVLPGNPPFLPPNSQG